MSGQQPYAAAVHRPPAAGRLALPAALVLALLLLGGGAVPAHAAGTGGIVVTPVPGVRDGKPVTSFRVDLPGDGTAEVPFTIANVETGPRTARVYLAPVRRTDGSFALGREGDSPYARLEDRRVTLQPGEVLDASFTVDGSEQPDGEALAAVVVEVTNGAVTTQASTLVYLTPARTVPLPLLVVAGAVGLLTAVGVGVLLAARRRRTATG